MGYDQSGNVKSTQLKSNIGSYVSSYVKRQQPAAGVQL